MEGDEQKGDVVNFEAIIFDLDGTLVNSLADLADAMNVVLRADGLPGHPVDAYRKFVGHGIPELVKRALPESLRDEGTLCRTTAAMRAEYATRWTRKTRPYDGIPDLLERVRAAGFLSAVLTNKPEGPAREVVRRLLPDAGFTAVWGVRDGLPRKPDPGGAILLAGHLGVEPGNCIYLGDMPVDMETAAAAGMYPVGALWGFETSADALAAAGARMLVKHPSDMGVWIGE